MPNPVETKSFAFAVRIVNLHQYLSREHKEYVLSKQLLRSGTAVGALVREALQAESRPDFIHKLAIALKEAHETEYWILLLQETIFLKPKQAQSILSDNKELQKLLTS
ncbi:MAG: four helix bundle protein, partial [Planctomycetaceae bacterium]|nr:four helix bundle protein [Planctomycetaceae bacterium]